MKATIPTILLMAAFMISISGGTALADKHNQHNDKVVSTHTKVVKQQWDNRQHKNYVVQARHNKNTQQIRYNSRDNRGNRIARSNRNQQFERQQFEHRNRIARSNRNQQFECQQFEHSRCVAAPGQYNNQYRRDQLQSSRIIIPLPLPRVALFFPW